MVRWNEILNKNWFVRSEGRIRKIKCFSNMFYHVDKKICYVPEMRKNLSKRGLNSTEKKKILGKTTKIHDITCNPWRFLLLLDTRLLLLTLYRNKKWKTTVLKGHKLLKPFFSVRWPKTNERWRRFSKFYTEFCPKRQNFEWEGQIITAE